MQSLAVTFPQSLYYSLRTSLLSLREGAHRAASDMQKARLKAQEDGVEWTSECGRGGCLTGYASDMLKARLKAQEDGVEWEGGACKSAGGRV